MGFSIRNLLPAGNSTPVLKYIAAFLVLLVLCLGVFKCARADNEIDVGYGSQVLHAKGFAAGLSLTYRQDLPIDMGPNRNVRLFVGTTMLSPDGIGDSNNWSWYGGIEGNRGFLHVGIGASYWQNINGIVGSHTNYILYASYRRWKWCPITAWHFSDAGTTSTNVGYNVVGCEWKIAP